MSTVDEVRDRLDIVDLVGDYVTLKKSGRSFKGLCPFHDEKTPSFVVFPDSGNWRCFGACATGGDAFDFLMRIENMDFRAALERLAQRVGVELEPASPRQAQRLERRQRLRGALEVASERFHDDLARPRDAGARRAAAYVEARGFGRDALDAFQLGYAPDDWQRTGDALRAQGFSEQELLDCGLLRARESGGTYDYFRGRLMIPIRNLRGDVIGFGARAIDPEAVPKYLNSPQSEVFDKGRTLFGLDRAAGAIRERGEVVVVEGYTDVIRAHMSGHENVVASLGTALTEHHVNLLKRFAPVGGRRAERLRVVLALDADAAGREATLRGLEVAGEAGSESVPVPTARGVMRFDQRLEIDLAVATLPPGRDPDDVIREDPEAWAALVAGALPVMEHLFQVLTADLDLDDARGKTEAVDRLMPHLAAISDPVARAAWVARLADVVRIDERTLAARLPRGGSGRAGSGRRRRPRGEGPAVGDERPGAPMPEAFPGEAPPPARAPEDLATWLLGHILVAPGRLESLDAALREDGVAAFSSKDLDRPTDRDLLSAARYAAHGVAPPDAPPEHRFEAWPDTHAQYAAELRRRAAAEPPLDEPTRQKALRAAVLRLRLQRQRKALEALRFLQSAAEPEERADYDRRVGRTMQELAALQRLVAPLKGALSGKRDRAL